MVDFYILQSNVDSRATLINLQIIDETTSQQKTISGNHAPLGNSHSPKKISHAPLKFFVQQTEYSIPITVEFIVTQIYPKITIEKR
jgi:hypothetical protein